MKKGFKCPLCYKKVYSGLGKGCYMCGMPLEDKSKEFCSGICRSKYKKINKLSELFKNKKNEKIIDYPFCCVRIN